MPQSLSAVYIHLVFSTKYRSNLWLKEEGGLTYFEWQAGYADFSVSHSNLEQVQKYIANQKEHHRKLSFQDEVRALLTKHQMEWDERYIWD
jgi:REP element-mobilizing transposase RayT